MKNKRFVHAIKIRSKLSLGSVLSNTVKDKCYYSQSHLANCSRTAYIGGQITQHLRLHLSFYQSSHHLVVRLVIILQWYKAESLQEKKN